MQAQPTPLANRLLIALPALADPNFQRTVALVCQHDEEGAMGVLVNRPSEFTLGDVFEQMGIETGDEALRSQIVLSGGPVHPERGFVLHDGGDGWDSTLAVSDKLYVTTSRDILEAIASGTGPRHAVVALGCAGWGAGQLEQELTEDTWLSVPVEAGLLFDTPLDARWRAAAGTLGVDITQLADHSGHA